MELELYHTVTFRLSKEGATQPCGLLPVSIPCDQRSSNDDIGIIKSLQRPINPSLHSKSRPIRSHEVREGSDAEEMQQRNRCSVPGQGYAGPKPPIEVSAACKKKRQAVGACIVRMNHETNFRSPLN